MMPMKTITYHCRCGATLEITDLPHRADWQLECFLADHRQEDGCAPVDAETAARQRGVSAQALARSTALSGQVS